MHKIGEAVHYFHSVVSQSRELRENSQEVEELRKVKSLERESGKFCFLLGIPARLIRKILM